MGYGGKLLWDMQDKKLKPFTKKWWFVVDKQIISKLPEIPIIGRDNKLAMITQVITGETLLQKNPDAKVKDENIDPKAMYTVPVSPIFLSHKRNIAKAYRKGGWTEVTKYVEYIEKTVADANAKFAPKEETKEFTQKIDTNEPTGTPDTDRMGD